MMVSREAKPNTTLDEVLTKATPWVLSLIYSLSEMLCKGPLEDVVVALAKSSEGSGEV